MKKFILFSIAVILFAAVKVRAQDDDFNERARKYVQQYYKLAIAEQRRCGIPASITLGQGILETEAGISELMIQANNHFGIKCKNGWEGPTFLHTDDAPNECFKKYGCAADSYKDHSDHLKRNQRYSPLFKLKETDYTSWAVCLKKCGYATNPQYAQRLIKIIEDFKLQEYTYAAMDSDVFNNYPVVPVAYVTPLPDTNKKPLPAARMATHRPDTTVKPQADVSAIKEMADSARELVTRKEEPVTPQAEVNADTPAALLVNGLRAFYAHKGETLYEYEKKYTISHNFLLEINDLRNAPLPFDMNIYLERKLTKGVHEKHIVNEGETLLMIAQMEGMQLRSLRALNRLNPNEEPVTGSILELQTPTHQKPTVRRGELPAHTKNAIVTSEDTGRQSSDFIAVNKPHGAIPQLPAGAQAPVADTQAAAANADSIAAAEEAPIPETIPLPVAAAKPVEKSTSEMTYEEIEAQAEKRKEFAKLKAELDKIVYADDSKLAAMQNSTPPATITKPVTTPETNISDKYYTVKKGDTAFSIAKNNNITVDQLYKWNNIEAADIKEGKTLQVKE